MAVAGPVLGAQAGAHAAAAAAAPSGTVSMVLDTSRQYIHLTGGDVNVAKQGIGRCHNVDVAVRRG